jgi:hypothetical protein
LILFFQNQIRKIPKSACLIAYKKLTGMATKAKAKKSAKSKSKKK